MPAPHEWATPRLEGAALLERAVGYTRTSLQLVATTSPTAPTPCHDWDLLALLNHMNDSLSAFTEAAEIGYVDLVPVRDAESDPARTLLLVDRLKARACALLAAWTSAPGVAEVQVHDAALRSDVLAAAGSLEIAVHGWDVARACGVDRPLPAALALDLLDVVPILVGEDDLVDAPARPARFAEPLVVPLHARPSTRLLAAVGRAPW